MESVDANRRRFSAAERVALYLVADGRCTGCGEELEPGWHADHVNPHVRGGPTDVVNGQALCPPCNLRKGAKIMGSRQWQVTALDRFRAHPSPNFLLVATPGAGKTRTALDAARELLDANLIQRVIVVGPTGHMRKQWQKAAHEHYRIQLDPKFENGNGAIARGFHGVVVTYSAVASQPQLYRKLASDRRTLVILDEVHHAGDERTWGDALRLAFEPAIRRLLLSGTPFRSDGRPIPFVEYDQDGRAIPDYSYDYRAGLKDGVVRHIAFSAQDGTARWFDAGALVEGTLSNESEDQAQRALRAALDPQGEWPHSVLRAADAELSRTREETPDAGGLVIASNQWHARAYATALAEITGESVAVAISDEPDASAVITAYANGRSRWLVAVAMVSEGVDIPRLAVGVYATNVTAELRFRQIVGRFVRTRGPADDLCATMFVPSTQKVLALAAQVEEESRSALAELVEEAELGGDAERSAPEWRPAGSDPAEQGVTILGDETFTSAETENARSLRELAGLPASVSLAQVAKLVRLAGGASFTANAQEPPTPSVADQRDALRKTLRGMVAQYCRLAGEEHKAVHYELNQRYGDKVGTAGPDTLRARIADLGKMLADAR